MTEFSISLGANLADRAAALQGAVDSLAATPGVHVRAVSPVYETAPVGGPEQPDFLNAVVVGETTLMPRDLLRVAQSIEHAWHRTRDVVWGPRTLDVDIIAMGAIELDEPDLVVPHPRARERAFVCVPLHAADPGAVIGTQPVAELIRTLDCDGVQRLEGVTLSIPEPA